MVITCSLLRMNPFQEMLRKTTASIYHDKMIRFALPLYDHFGINHFWYYQITYLGHYSYVGTHQPWNEFCFDNSLVNRFTCLRHPDLVKEGISLMRATTDEEYKKVLDVAWEKFKINFNINLVTRSFDGIEAFGFATCFNDPHAEERLLNHLPLLRGFIKAFKANQKNLLRVLDNNRMDLSVHFGQQFYEYPKALTIPFEKEKFLKSMGFDQIISLTPREKDVLKFICNGYPASYIAEQLQLSKKTVENYLSTIKCKLGCSSKTTLIEKTQGIAATGYFDF